MIPEPANQQPGFSDYNRPQFIDPRMTFTPTVSTSDLIKAEAGAVYHDSPIVSLFRQKEFSERGDTTMSPLISPDEAKRRFGVDTGNEWWTEAQADFIQQDNQKQADRASMISRKGGLMQGLVAFGAGMAGFTADPLNFAMLALPFVGELRYAKLVQALAGEERAAAISRGIVAEQAARAGQGALETAAADVGATAIPRAEVSFRTIAEAGASPATRLAARVLGSGAQAGAGFALLEPFNYAMAKADRRDYDSQAALENIIAGAALGGLIHGVFGGIGDAIQSPEVRYAKAMMVAKGFMDDTIPDFEYINALDPVRLYEAAINHTDLQTGFPDIYKHGPDSGVLNVKLGTDEKPILFAAKDASFPEGTSVGTRQSGTAVQRQFTPESVPYIPKKGAIILNESSPDYHQFLALTKGDPVKMVEWAKKNGFDAILSKDGSFILNRDAFEIPPFEVRAAVEAKLKKMQQRGELSSDRISQYKDAIQSKMHDLENQTLAELKMRREQPSLLENLGASLFDQPTTDHPDNPVKMEEKIKQAEEQVTAAHEDIAPRLSEGDQMALDEKKAEVAQYELPLKTEAPKEGALPPELVKNKATAILEGLNCFNKNL